MIAAAPLDAAAVAEEAAADFDRRAETGARWRLLGASVIGESHRTRGEPRQDAFALTTVGPFAILVAADGLGSALYAHVGARLAAEAMCARLAAAAALALEIPHPQSRAGDGRTWADVTHDALADIRAALQPTEALIDGAVRALYDTTLLAAVAGPEGGFFVHVGDGCGLAVTAPEPGDFGLAVASAPANGAFENETFPITLPDIGPHVRFTAFGPADVLFLMTDGVTPFALADEAATLRPRFLQPIDRHLAANPDDAGAAALLQTLDGPELRRNHADDKTLLWARVQR